MHELTVEEAKGVLPELLREATTGQEVFITQEPATRIRLVPAPAVKPKPEFGSAKGLIRIREDFDEPLEDFAEYME